MISKGGGFMQVCIMSGKKEPGLGHRQLWFRVPIDKQEMLKRMNLREGDYYEVIDYDYLPFAYNGRLTVEKLNEMYYTAYGG